MSRVFPLLPLATWLLVALPSASCIGASQQIKQDERELETLGKSAELYWDAVRWGDTEKGGAFIEKQLDRVAWEDWLLEQKDKRRLVSADVVAVELSDSTGEGRRREATVMVRTEGYTMPDQVLKTETVTQHWYLTLTAWYLVWPE